MKKRVFVVVTLIALVILCGAVAGCQEVPEDTTPKEYIIQYTDDSGTYKITVTQDMPYTLDVIPSRMGYKFMGLFDAEVGGTQYVSASGASLSPFTDGKNLVLFPQFKANDYTIVLDYQGAQVTGERQFTVAYGASLPQLPKNLTGEHKTFSGWYTQANCQGTQVADQYGLVPIVSVLNDNNFDLSADLIYLYAGFEVEKFTVTCFFEAGMDSEELQVEYDTPVSQIVPDTRVEGKAPLTWSKTQGGEVFNGKIIGDTVLYALEYAPVIDFDVNGGKKINSLVARAGSTVALPTPTKDLAKFAYWEDMQGNRYTTTTMPSSSISLKAIWQGKLVFDSNGGSDVKEITELAGTKITLPTPEREGFLFAGWFNADKEQFVSTNMPVAGLLLKAGWYKEKSKSEILVESNASKRWASGWDLTEPRVDKNSHFEILLNDLNLNRNSNVRIDFNISVKNDSASNNLYVNIYSQKQVSSVFLLKKLDLGNFNDTYKKFNFTVSLIANENLYFCFYCSKDKYANASDVYYTLYYPDTTNLYL